MCEGLGLVCPGYNHWVHSHSPRRRLKTGTPFQSFYFERASPRSKQSNQVQTTIDLDQLFTDEKCTSANHAWQRFGDLGFTHPTGAALVLSWSRQPKERVLCSLSHMSWILVIHRSCSSEPCSAYRNAFNDCTATQVSACWNGILTLLAVLTTWGHCVYTRARFM